MCIRDSFWSASYNTQSQERHRLIGDLHAEFRLTDGLNVRFRTSTDWYNAVSYTHLRHSHLHPCHLHN